MIPVASQCATSSRGTTPTDQPTVLGDESLNRTIDGAEINIREHNEMSKDTPYENRSRCTTSTEVSIDDVLQLEDGDAIAVRAVQGEFERIIAGRAFDPAPKSEVEKALEKPDRHPSLVAIDTNIWWDLKDGEINDRSDELVNRPPYQDFLGDPPKEAPSCSLAGRADRSVKLIIPMPVYKPSRIYYYAPDTYGTLVAIDTGAIADPEALVPAGYGPIP